MNAKGRGGAGTPIRVHRSDVEFKVLPGILCDHRLLLRASGHRVFVNVQPGVVESPIHETSRGKDGSGVQLAGRGWAWNNGSLEHLVLRVPHGLSNTTIPVRSFSLACGGCHVPLTVATDRARAVDSIQIRVCQKPGLVLLAGLPTVVHGTVVEVSHEVNRHLDTRCAGVGLVGNHYHHVVKSRSKLRAALPARVWAGAAIGGGPRVPLHKAGHCAGERVRAEARNLFRLPIGRAPPRQGDLLAVQVALKRAVLRPVVRQELSGGVVSRPGRGREPDLLRVREGLRLAPGDSSHLQLVSKPEGQRIPVWVHGRDLELGPHARELVGDRQDGGLVHDRRSVPISFEPNFHLQAVPPLLVVVQHRVEGAVASPGGRQRGRGVVALVETLPSGEEGHKWVVGVPLIGVCEGAHTSEGVAQPAAVVLSDVSDLELNRLGGPIPHEHPVELAPGCALGGVLVRVVTKVIAERRGHDVLLVCEGGGPRENRARLRLPGVAVEGGGARDDVRRSVVLLLGRESQKKSLA